MNLLDESVVFALAVCSYLATFQLSGREGL